MAYTSDKKSTGLDVLTGLDSGDLHIVGDISDSGRAKAITQNNLEIDIANSNNFVDTLVANNYFTTELAGDTNFITNLQTSGIGSTVDVQENGVSVENPVDTINFVAPSGTVTTPSAGVVDINLSSLMGGGSGGNLLYDAWDDFLSSIYTAGSSNEFSSISILNWTGRASGGNSIGQYLNGEADHPGIFQLEGIGSNNAAIYLGDPDNVIYPISEFAQSGNEYNFTVRCNDTTSQTSAAIIKIGETTSVFSTLVTNNEIQIIFDTTNNDIIFSTRDSTTTQSTTIKSSFTTSFYNFRVVCSGTDIKCYVDDILEATHSTNIPATNVSGSVVFTALNGEELDIDFFGMKYGRELSGSGIQTKTVTLSNTDINGMYASPYTLVAAPGVGKVNVVESALFYFDYGTVQYTGGGSVSIIEETSGTPLAASFNDTFITAASNAIIQRNASAPVATSLTENKAIQLTNATGAFAAGDGTLKVILNYRVITL